MPNQIDPQKMTQALGEALTVLQSLQDGEEITDEAVDAMKNLTKILGDLQDSVNTKADFLDDFGGAVDKFYDAAREVEDCLVSWNKTTKARRALKPAKAIKKVPAKKAQRI